MPMLDPFSGSAYGLAELTAAINVVPNRYGRFQQLGIFAERGVRTTSVIVEHRNQTLNLLPFVARGGPASRGEVGKRDVRSFVIPHIPHDDVVLPEEVQDIRGFGSETELDAIQSLMNDKLETMARKHDITREWLFASALQGKVRGADNTVVLDFFGAFGISQTTQDFTFATDPRADTASLIRKIEDNLKGETMTGIRVFCSPGFWDVFIAAAEVKEAYKEWQDGAWLRQNPLTAFPLWGVEWEEYRGQASDVAGNARLFVPTNEAIAIPMGTTDTFRCVYGPADFNETVNTVGRRMYAKQKERDFGRGWDLHTQSNPLPLVLRPALIVKVTKS